MSVVANGIEVLTELHEQAAAHHTAIVVVDMLNDYVHPQGKAAVEGKRPIEYALAIIPKLRALVDSGRAAGATVVWSMHSTQPNYASSSGPWLAARGHATYSAREIALEGSWGQQVLDELNPQPADLISKKHRYSAFAGTNLDLLLRSRRIRTVVVAGVSTNVCVEATVRAAFDLDYYVIVPEDAVASWDQRLHAATLDNVRHRMGKVVTVDALQAVWKEDHRA